jgi:hypothetical protein
MVGNQAEMACAETRPNLHRPLTVALRASVQEKRIGENETYDAEKTMVAQPRRHALLSIATKSAIQLCDMM